MLRVESTPEPVVGPGRALIGVEFAGITWIETMFRAAGFGPFPAPPMIPGNGVGGTVLAVGSDDDAHLVGKRVVTGTGGAGGYAERVAVDAATVIEVPAGVALDDATALLADGRTALMIMEAAGVRSGDRVLVEAAAGGVGSLLVQLAAAAGAEVVGAAGSARKLETARDLGAHTVVDYRAAGWGDAVGAVDVVLDGVGGVVAEAAFGLLGTGGRMISFGFSGGKGWPEVPGEERGIRVQRGVFGTPEEQIRCTREALRLAEDGRLRAVIGQRFALEWAAEAHAGMEARTAIGKTLLTV